MPAAREVAAILADVQAALEAVPGCLLARMSGSGGTTSASSPSLADAETAARSFARATRSVDRDPAASGLTVVRLCGHS